MRKVHDDASQIKKVLPEDGRREVLEQGTLALVFNTAGMEWIACALSKERILWSPLNSFKNKNQPSKQEATSTAQVDIMAVIGNGQDDSDRGLGNGDN